MDPNLLMMLSVARLRKRTYRTVPRSRWACRVVLDRKYVERKCTGCGVVFQSEGNRRCSNCHEKEGRLGNLAAKAYTIYGA